MKHTHTVSMLVGFAMMSSCQKQDSTAEQQIAQQKAELAALEKALDERLNGLEERMNELDKRISALAETRGAEVPPPPPAVQSHAVISDPAQVQSERQAAVQQFSAEVRPPTTDTSNVDSETNRIQKRRAPTQRELEDQQSSRQRKLELMQKWQMSRSAVSPAAEANSPAPSSTTTSPTPP